MTGLGTHVGLYNKCYILGLHLWFARINMGYLALLYKKWWDWRALLMLECLQIVQIVPVTLATLRISLKSRSPKGTKCIDIDRIGNGGCTVKSSQLPTYCHGWALSLHTESLSRNNCHLMEALYGVVPDKASITLHLRLSALSINRPSGRYVIWGSLCNCPYPGSLTRN